MIENFKISRPVLVCFLLLCFGTSPILATGSGSNDPEGESELPNLQGFLWTLVTFSVLWFASVGCYGIQQDIFRYYAREGHEVPCPRGPIFPPVIVTEPNPHANLVPPRCNDPGGGHFPGKPRHGSRGENLCRPQHVSRGSNVC